MSDPFVGPALIVAWGLPILCVGFGIFYVIATRKHWIKEEQS